MRRSTPALGSFGGFGWLRPRRQLNSAQAACRRYTDSTALGAPQAFSSPASPAHSRPFSSIHPFMTASVKKGKGAAAFLTIVSFS